MGYEYLKGMGTVAPGATSAGLVGPAHSSNPTSSPTSSPPAAPPASGGSSGTMATQSGGGMTMAAGASSLLFGAAAAGARPSGSSSAPAMVATGMTATPKVPSNSVTTKPEERADLKEWCRQVFGQSNAFYKEKLAKDPNFTYMNANTLAQYRNGVETVIDMLRGQGDGAVTVGDVSALKAWWAKCHKGTYVTFSLRYKGWGKTDTWVPLKLSVAWKQSYKATGACPNNTQKKALFEYQAHTLASNLLKEEAARQQAALATQAAQANAAKAAAKKAKAEAAKLKAAAEAAKKAAAKSKADAAAAAKKLAQAQANAKAAQQKIAALNAQLASAPSADAVAKLQAQVQALSGQLAQAQAQIPVAQVEVQQADTVAMQTEAQVVQADAVAVEATVQADQIAAVADQVSEGIEPWYLQYKWYLLGGLAAVAAGAWWYFKGRQPAVALAKNGLPVPMSAKHPSGLRGNRTRGR